MYGSRNEEVSNTYGIPEEGLEKSGGRILDPSGSVGHPKIIQVDTSWSSVF